MIISRTPVRVSFFGGGTDYREYFERKGGAVLGTTINKYLYVSLNRLSEFFTYKIRVSYSKSELVNHIDEIKHPSTREVLRFKNVNGYIDIHIFSDLPSQTGLGSSSSFTVGFLNAIYAIQGIRVSKQHLAEEAIHIEQDMVKEKVGCQDQVHAAYGGLNIIEFSKAKISVRPVIISQEKGNLLQESSMFFYTGLTRYSSEILKEQIDATNSCSNDKYLGKMHQMVYEAEQIISDENPEYMIKRLGKLLHESWNLKKCLSSQITNDVIDNAYSKAIQAGAYGGKLAGAGRGGFLFLLTPKSRQQAVRKALSGLLEVDFKFENEGTKIIYFHHDRIHST